MGANDMKENRITSGVLSFPWAIAAAGSVTMIGFTSFTAFNPPDGFGLPL